MTGASGQSGSIWLERACVLTVGVVWAVFPMNTGRCGRHGVPAGQHLTNEVPVICASLNPSCSNGSGQATLYETLAGVKFGQEGLEVTEHP